jgi:nicotinamide-nucleotide amidase
MIAEILAVGSELTHGAKLDTNSQWLSLELEAQGVDVGFHTTVADDLAANVLALRIAADRADLLLITGGLGPTLDDLTRDALAQWAGVPLVFHAESYARIAEMFARRGRSMPERNRVQALFPTGAAPLPNPIGTAPGIWLETPRPGRGPFRIAALPGVPSEMHRMFQEQVVPRLPATGRRLIRHNLHCFGCGESQAEELLGDLTARGREPEIGITAHDAVITLRVTARGATTADCQRQIDAAARQIRERLGLFVFGEADDELEQVVLRQLQQRGETLAVVDLGTGGWLPRALAAVRSPALQGGIVAPSLSAAERWLGPSLEAAAAPEEWSPHVAAPGGEAVGAARGDATQRVVRLAESCRAPGGATYGLAVGPLPECSSLDELAASADQVTLALAGPRGVQTTHAPIGGNPAILAPRLGKTAIDLLRRQLRIA